MKLLKDSNLKKLDELTRRQQSGWYFRLKKTNYKFVSIYVKIEKSGFDAKELQIGIKQEIDLEKVFIDMRIVKEEL